MRRCIWCPDGRSILASSDADGWENYALTFTGLPPGVYAKEHGSLGFALQFTQDGRGVVTPIGRATAPTRICHVDPAIGAIRPPVGPEPGRGGVEPDVVRYPSTDGLAVPALLYRPRDAGPKRPAPVVVIVHGGPENQSYPIYDPLVQYLLHRGIGVLAPNYRGSTGYAKAYQKRIYRDRGGGELQDLGAGRGISEGTGLGGR